MFVRQLLTLQACPHIGTNHSDEGITNLSMADIPDQLIQRCNVAVKLAVSGGDPEKSSNLKSRWYLSRRSQRALGDIGPTVTRQTPRVGDLVPIQMTVLTDFKGVLWVEPTAANISWLTKAIALQVEDGKPRSKRAKHHKSSASSEDAESNAAESADVAHVVGIVPPWFVYV